MRGRTAAGRLIALDRYLVRCEPGLFAPGSLFVDVGFGDAPVTLLEAVAAFRSVCPSLRAIGVEQEPARVASALSASSDVDFRVGGFELPLRPEERPRLIRAMNVLRGYPQEAVASAHSKLGAALSEGGLLVEGSSERDASVLCAHLLRRSGGGLVREGLLLFTDFSRGFAPLLFRDWLPRDLRRRVRPGEGIHSFLHAWSESWEAVRGGPVAEVFSASALGLSSRVDGVVVDPWLLANGYLLWRPPGGVPA